ncbi:unnamed protein product, partial [Candidula unifasciata]
MTSRIPSRPVQALITMLVCFSVLGLLGNALVIYVYARKRNKLSSTVFIIALACIDLVTSAVGMPYTIVVEGLDYQISLDFSCKFYYFIITCTVPFSVFIMVAIAIDRYICICRPHSHVLDATRARNSVFVLLVVAMALGVITAMFYGVYIDVATLKKSNVFSEPVEKFVKGKIGNLTDELNLLEGNNCPQCVNHSNDAQFSERFVDVLVELYKTACDRENLSNESYIYTGHCLPNQIVFSDNFRRTYQTIYSSSFLFCFFVVFVLYICIYRSVLSRRARRFAARSKTKVTLTQEVSLTENQSMLNDSPDKSIAMADINNGTHDKSHLSSTSNTQPTQNLLERQTRQHIEVEELQHEAAQKTAQPNNGCLRDKYFLANIRTAIMLFVVTVAFVIAYLPSWLMAFKVIHFNVIIFYVYFSNHIVNPIIYAFMNPAFRRSLKGL